MIILYPLPGSRVTFFKQSWCLLMKIQFFFTVYGSKNCFMIVIHDNAWWNNLTSASFSEKPGISVFLNFSRNFTILFIGLFFSRSRFWNIKAQRAIHWKMRKLSFRNCSSKIKTKVADIAYLIRFPWVGRQAVLNKTKFYIQMFTCKLFLSGSVELALIVCKRLKFCFLWKCKRILCYNKVFLNF